MKFYVDYEDKEGDLCHVWVNAESSSDAEAQAKREYWDIENIISIHK
jgi:hypothetical protein